MIDNTPGLSIPYISSLVFVFLVGLVEALSGADVAGWQMVSEDQSAVEEFGAARLKENQTSSP